MRGDRWRGWFSSCEPLFNGRGSTSYAGTRRRRAVQHLLEGGVELEALVDAEAGLAEAREAREALAKGPVLAIRVARQRIQTNYTAVSTCAGST